MKPTIPSNRLAFYLSSQLRLNALWSVWVSYAVGAVLIGGVSRASALADLLCLAGISLISALWNDWADQDVDTANQRRHTWKTLHPQQVYCIQLVAFFLIVIPAFLSLPRLLWVIAVFGLGYLYNSAAFSRRPVASLVLYALYYRVAPFILAGLSARHAFALWGVAAALGVLKLSSGVYKDIKDRIGDAKHGKTTFVLWVGLGRARLFSFVLWLLGGALLLVAGKPADGKVLAATFVAATIIRGGLLLYGGEGYQAHWYRRAFQAENFLLFSIIFLALIAGFR